MRAALRKSGNPTRLLSSASGLSSVANSPVSLAKESGSPVALHSSSQYKVTPGRRSPILKRDLSTKKSWLPSLFNSSEAVEDENETEWEEETEKEGPSLKVESAQATPETYAQPKRDQFETFGEYSEALQAWQLENQLNFGDADVNDKVTVSYEPIHHGNHLPPEEVFKTGLPAKGENLDLEQHVKDSDNSARRGGAVSAAVATGLVGGPGHEGAFHVYKVHPRGGAVVVDSALADYGKTKYQNEQEHVFGAHQPTEDIEGAYEVGQWSEGFQAHALGKFHPNPNFDPRRQRRLE